MKRIRWIWCWAAYHLWVALPFAPYHETRYGKFRLWLLAYAGSYAHSEDFKDFCRRVC
jgi:hypothetical protein